MQALLAHHRGRVNLLDHHKTAQEALEGRIAGATFDMDRSGAVMAWEHFHPGEPVPELLRYVQDRDLWDWKLPGSREINEALQQADLDFALWYSFTIPALLEEGTALRATAMEQIRANLARASYSDILGHAVPSVDTDRLMSDTAEQLLMEHPDAPFAAVYYHTEQDHVPATKFSLRSRKGGTDVSEIARVLGGGGHANAAGFVIVLGHQVPGRPELHPSDTRHHEDQGLRQLAETPPEDRTRDQQAALEKTYELQVVADDNAESFHNIKDEGDDEPGGQLWAEMGFRHMLSAHHLARMFPEELPLPSFPLDPDPFRDSELRRAHYSGAMTFPALQDMYEHRNHYPNRKAAHDETDDLPF